MALPRFLYSQSDSTHEQLIPKSECEEPLLVSPKTKRDFTGALSKRKKEIANNPALRPSFVGNLDYSSESEGEGEDKEAAQQGRNRREWEFGAAAVAMELSEPGAGDGSDSDESGILEHMGEKRPESRKKKERNGVVGDRVNIGINDGVSDSFQTSGTTVKSSHSSKRTSGVSSGTEEIMCHLSLLLR